MKKTLWIPAFTLCLAAGVAGAEPVEERHVVVKLAGVGGEPGLSTFDLSQLAIGESRELVSDTGRTIVAQRDTAGYLLDLGDGKTVRVGGGDNAVIVGGDGHRTVHVDKRVVRLGGDGGPAKVMMFSSADGDLVELEGDSASWTSISGDEGYPRVMIFRSEDGEITQLSSDEAFAWSSRDAGEGRAIKRIVRLDGESEGQLEALVAALAASGKLDEAALEALLEKLRGCEDGADCDDAHKVVIVKTRVETETREE